MSRAFAFSSLFAVALLIASGGVCAQSSQFNLTGEITPPTCSWSTGDLDRAVTLDPISLMALTPGKVSGLKAFDISIERCDPGVTSATFIFSGIADANDVRRFRNAGTAAGVAVELQASDGTTITPGGSTNFRVVPVVANGATLNLQVGYWLLGGTVASSGTVSATAMVTMLYN